MATQEAAESTQLRTTDRGRDARRGYRVAPEFQDRFRVKVLALAFLVASVSVALVKVVDYLVVHATLLNSPAVPLWLTATILVLVGVIARVCDRISHRVAGPAHRLRCTLEAVLRGERPAPIRLRDGDELQELADALNATLQRLDAMDPPRD